MCPTVVMGITVATAGDLWEKVFSFFGGQSGRGGGGGGGVSWALGGSGHVCVYFTILV